MENNRENLEHPLDEISQILDQVLIFLGQSVNTCTYFCRFNILMAFVNDKKKVEKMIKENSHVFIYESNSNMLVVIKFGNTAALRH